MRSISTVITAALLALVLTSPGFAQSTFATITGTVTDPSGAAVPGASVEVRNVKTGYVYNATSNGDGVYSIPNLLEGEYQLKASGKGFGEFIADNIILNSRDNRRIEIKLQLSSVAGTVEVTAAGVALIETETARVSDIKDREQMRALPLTLRRAWDYFTLSPQITRTTTGFNISLGGTHANQSEASIDGITVTPAGGGFAMGPIMDRSENLQELRVDVSGNSAEYGTPGSIALTTRAGNNDFHGTFSDYYSSPFMRARNPFATSRGTGVSHRLTFAAGGPVYIPKVYNGHGKTFFFVTLEMGAGSAGTSLVTQTVPLQAWRKGDFRGVPGLFLRDPLKTGACNATDQTGCFANNMIPVDRLNPVSLKMQEMFFATPNFGDTNRLQNQNYRQNRLGRFSHQPQLTIRLDHRFSEKDFVYGRFIGVYWNIPNYETVAANTDLFRQTRNLRSWQVSYSHTFTPTLVNEVRWGLTSDHLPIESAIRGKDVVQELGLQGLAPDLPDVGGAPKINFTNIGLSNIAFKDTCDPCFKDRVIQFTDSLTWTKGVHTIKMGGELRWGHTDDFRQGANVFGGATFSGQYTNQPYADFLLGIPTTVSRNFPTVPMERLIRTYSGWVTDEWKVTPKLTVSAGLRYQLYKVPMDKNGRMALFDTATGSIVVPDGSLKLVSPLLPTNYIKVIEASQAGYPNSLLEMDKNNFAPRLSVAWRPFDNRTVIRAGAGIYYDNAPPDPVLGANVPFLISEPPYQNTATNPLMFPFIFPATAGGPTTIAIPRASRKDLRVPRSGQYTLTIERQQWDMGFRVTYTGTNTRQGIYRFNINQPVADARLYADKQRLFPRYPDIQYGDNGSGHQYHGISFEVERRMKKGLAFQAYYTRARDIGDLENTESPEDAYNRVRERAAWGSLPQHRFSSNTVVELPFGKGRRWMTNSHRLVNGALGGWLIGGIYSYETGTFFTPTWTGLDPTGTRFANPGTRATVTLRPDQLREGNLSDPTLAQWFDVGAFGAPPLGRFGTSAKGVLVGPPVNVFHSTLSKHFSWRERVRFKFEVLATNLLNHPNYMQPNPSISAGIASGSITAVMDRNAKFDSAVTREFQMQFRVEW
jgi:carboxypeptidase family protein